MTTMTETSTSVRDNPPLVANDAATTVTGHHHAAPPPGSTMRAVVKAEAGPGAQLQQVPVPQVGADEALIRVRATSICGTDLHIYNWDPWAQGRVQPPQTMGHEFCGDIVAVGSNVRGFQPGDFVSVETHITCGHCYQCQTDMRHICQNVEIIGVDRDGCFAEYIAVPAAVCWTNDPNLALDLASIMEPFGNAVHTALAQPLITEYVAVVGCGPLGLWAIGIARAAGAVGVAAIDVNNLRLDLARQMGATLTINSMEQDPVAAVRAATAGVGAGVVLEMSGNARATQQAFEMMRFGGDISMLGTPARPYELDMAGDVIFKGATVHGITGRRIWKTWYQSRALLAGGLVDPRPVITHHLPLDQFDTAFRLMNEGKSGKIVLIP